MKEAAPDRLKYKSMLIDSLPQATPEKKNMGAGHLPGNRAFDGRFQGACCILAGTALLAANRFKLQPIARLSPMMPMRRSTMCRAAAQANTMGAARSCAEPRSGHRLSTPTGRACQIAVRGAAGLFD